MKIYASNKQANGVYASVMFVNGVGETDNPHLIEWFKNHGYTMEKCDNSHEIHVKNVIEPTQYTYAVENDVIEPLNDDVEKSFEDMTPNELRQWMMENGFGSKIRNTRNKEKLLEILRG